MNLWIDVALMATLFALGNILFGHFEERRRSGAAG